MVLNVSCDVLSVCLSKVWRGMKGWFRFAKYEFAGVICILRNGTEQKKKIQDFLKKNEDLLNNLSLVVYKYSVFMRATRQQS